MARITLKNVNKIYPSRFGEVHAVKDFNLDVADGEFVALLGPSGCGKTSTLRMIVGLEQITSGDISFDGRRVNDLEPRERNVAMAFETYALYPNFTIAENLGFPLEVRGFDEATRKKKIDAIAQIMRLEQILDQKPPSLSGGEQQRVSLGRALIRDPDVFILDEVMSHLDANLKFQMLLDLKVLHRELGRTMIYVTHDQMEALALADRVAVMDHALLQQAGTRNELYRTPANVFVADFIGEPPTNFFEMSIKTNGTALQLSSSDGSLTLSPPASHRTMLTERAAMNGAAKDVIAAIRPQHLSLANGTSSTGSTGSASGSADIASSTGSTGCNPTITAQVQINEYLGERSILTLKNGGQAFRALVPPDTAIQKGETVALTYDPENLMLFDKDTKQLIA